MPEPDKILLPALDRLRARWRMVAVACGVAAALALAVSLLLTKEYTAVSRLVIDPPAGSDPRASTAVSPIYLESLRSYELFAASDDLFFKAARRFGLRRSSAPFDRLKKSVLKAEVPRNTRILEIRATLPDPNTAHDLALYIAEETVKLNQAVSREGDQELTSGAEKQLEQARARLRSAEQAWSDAAAQAPVEPVQAELEADQELRNSLQRDLASSLALLPDSDERTGRFRRQLDSLQQSIAAKYKLLADRSARLNRLASERTAAETAAKAAEARLQDVRSTLGSRGERLRIIDPGVAPERPSFPNVPLNVGIALFAAFVLSVLGLMLEASYAAQRVEQSRRSIRVAGRHD
jgi:uncharacterized protein involved in exopolysaccharide biosynthesis